MRNNPGRLAVVVPWEGAEWDVQQHGGKIVKPVRHAACGIGPAAWHTDPPLTERNGLVLAWDDRDLKPLGKPPAVARKKAAFAT